MAVAEAEPDPDLRRQQAQLLQQLRANLEDQVSYERDTRRAYLGPGDQAMSQCREKHQ